MYRAFEAGAVDCLIKPLDAEVVRKKVAVFVELVRSREEVERQGVSGATPSSASSSCGSPSCASSASNAIATSSTIHPHPTLGESIMEAAKAALGESPHLVGGGQKKLLR